MTKYQMHEVEGALELMSAPPLIVPVAKLYTMDAQIQEHLKSSQIYFLMRRPRMSLIPGSLVWDGELLHARIKVQVKDNFEELQISPRLPFPSTFVPTRVWADEEYPSTTIYLDFDHHGEKGCAELHLSTLMLKEEIERPDLEHFHIDYIGHALGKNGLKGAIDRLVGRSGKRVAHEHLQEILVELNSQHPDHEAFVALFSFDEQRRHVSGGATSFTPIHLFDDDPERIWRFIDTPIPRDVRIKLAEAALVNHFKPRFNTHYKVWFATSKQRVLDYVRNIDFTAIGISFDTKWLGAKLRSENVAPSRIHKFSVPIATDAQRATLLDL